MRKWQLSIALVVVLLLGACGAADEKSSEHGSVNDGEAVNQFGAVDHGVDEKKIGFSLSGETIEEAADVPAEEKEQILEAFDVYIQAFNDKDIDRYLDTLSEQTESFDKTEEQAYMTQVFSEYELNRKASDVTIVKYSDSEAQVFAQLETSMKQTTSGLATDQSGRQVTVFTKEDGEWKVASVHYIGDDAKQ